MWSAEARARATGRWPTPRGAISADTTSQFIRCLVSKRLIAFGQRGKAFEQIQPGSWDRGTIDWPKSSLQSAAGTSWLNVKIFPALKAPNATEILSEVALADVFTKYLLQDPEVEAFGKKAVAYSPDLASIFSEGSSSRKGECYWPVDPDRHATLNITHPDENERTYFDLSRRPDGVDAVQAVGALFDRYLSLLAHLRLGAVIASGRSNRSCHNEIIETAIWQHEDFAVSRYGDIYRWDRSVEDDEEPWQRVWLGVMLRSARNNEKFHVKTTEVAPCAAVYDRRRRSLEVFKTEYHAARISRMRSLACRYDGGKPRASQTYQARTVRRS